MSTVSGYVSEVECLSFC